MTPERDDTNLTLEALIRSWRSLEFDASADFWAAMRSRFGVSKFAFSMHLPDDDHVYILATVPELGTSKTMIIPEKYRRKLPPLPSILDLTHPRTFVIKLDGVYEADGEEIRRISDPLFDIDPGPTA